MATFLRSAAAGEVFRTAERQNAKKSRIQVSGTVNQTKSGSFNLIEVKHHSVNFLLFLEPKFKSSTTLSNTVITCYWADFWRDISNCQFMAFSRFEASFD